MQIKSKIQKTSEISGDKDTKYTDSKWKSSIH